MAPGSVVLIRFPFSSLETTKKRPALVVLPTVLEAKLDLLTVAMITSRVEGIALAGDVRLEHWSDAGMLHPSLVRLAKLATIDQHLAERTLGQLTATDLAAVKQAFRSLYRFWISV